MMEFLINNISTKSLGFHLNPLFSIGQPKVKKIMVDVPFSHGQLDLTESVTDEVLYGNRLIKFTLEKTRPKSEWYSVYNDFVSRFHGKVVEVVPPYETDYYFKGRMEVGAMARGDYMSFQVLIDCEPFRIKNNLTIVSLSSTATESTVNLENSFAKTVPTIETDGAITVKHNSNQWSLNAGNHTLPIILNQGSNSIRVSGEAHVVIRYQERVI